MLTFLIIQLAPGGPETVFLAGENPSIKPEDIERLKEKWGLNKSIPEQYGTWLYRVVVKQDLGRSFISQRPVTEAYKDRLPATIQLNLVTFFFIYLISIPLGVFLAMRQNTWIDWIASTISAVGFAMPSFWVGLMLIVWVALRSHGALPTNGFATPYITVAHDGLFVVLMDRAKYMFLPAITLVFGSTAVLTQTMRGQMLDVIKEDYVRTAKAKGLAQKVVIYKHALRNALIPIITLSSGLIANLFGGAVVIEQIFAWPGVGQLALNGVNQKDYPVVMAFLLIAFVLTTISSFVTEFVYVLVDPRIKYS
jgi:peptide/nickel transport system permease protein